MITYMYMCMSIAITKRPQSDSDRTMLSTPGDSLLLTQDFKDDVTLVGHVVTPGHQISIAQSFDRVNRQIPLPRIHGSVIYPEDILLRPETIITAYDTTKTASNI